MDNSMDEHEYTYDKDLVQATYCKACQQIPWEKLFSGVYEACQQQLRNVDHPYDQSEKASSAHLLHNSVSELQSAAEKECCIVCDELWLELNDEFSEMPLNIHVIVQLQNQVDLRHFPYKPHVLLIYACHTDGRTYPYNIEKSISLKNGKLRVSKSVKQILTIPGHYLQKFVTNNSIPCSSLSTPTVSIMKEWLERCVQSHKLCGSSVLRDEPATFPTRLLDVCTDSSETICLVDGSTIEQDVQYVALSHCWGTGYTFKLRSDNMNAIACGVSMKLLPKTFCDAITVVRELGLRYLWIDSLCIIQDSSDDWKEESEKMSAVYSNALFTIAAARATSDEEGFLARRTAPPSRYIYRKSPKHEICPGIIIQGDGDTDYNYWQAVLSYEPLYSRGWVLQEQYLARRTFVFGERIVSWDCHSLHATESGFSTTEVHSDVEILIEHMTRDMDLRKAVSDQHATPP